MRARAKWKFSSSKKSQINLDLNEEVIVIREDTVNPGWGWAKRKNGDTGYVPLNYLEILKTPEEDEEAAEKPLAAPRFAAPKPPTKGKDKEDDEEVLLEALVTPRTMLDAEREELLAFVQSRIPSYYIEDFDASWKDGKALCALVNSLKPGTFDLPSQFSNLPLEDAAMAINKAEELLGIHPVINAYDVCRGNNADSVELYVRAFQQKQREFLEAADAEERKLRKKAAVYREALSKPSSEDVWVNIVGKTGKFHASISLEGVVTDRFGDVLGYIDLEDMKCASAIQEFQGYMMSDSCYDCRGNREDGVFCGEINRGTGCIHDQYGSTILEMDVDGHCKGQTQVYLGCFELCSRKELDVVALYCFFMDPDFWNEEDEDEEHREPHTAPEDSWCNVFDKKGNFLCSIDEEGSIKDNFGELIAYFDLESKRVASHEGFLLGYVSGEIVYNGEDEFIGELNRGTGAILGETGSTLVSLEQSGHCKGATSVSLGEFRGFSFKQLDLVALYCLCVNKNFVKEDAEI